MGILGSREEQERKQWLADVRDVQHPTPAKDLLQYLNGEFQHGVPLHIAGHKWDRVGKCLDDREVSRLEVISAIGRLPHRQRRIMELVYIDGVPCLDAAARLGISERTLYRERSMALDTMVLIIYEWSDN
jgi:DNA-directed RNA polymerase specialized sigma24 family protein